MAKLNVYGMCNALYDLQAEVPDHLITDLGFEKGMMTLVGQDDHKRILPEIASMIVKAESGGSGANTMIGVAQLGGTAAYTSRIGTDDHGRLYRDGLQEKGVVTHLGVADGLTGVSVILITDDAPRTMLTSLALARELRREDINLDDLRNSEYLYVTGYLWDTEEQKDAVTYAMEEARKAGVKVAFSLSDPFCVNRHKEDFWNLIRSHVDLLFGNYTEAVALTGIEDWVGATVELARHCEVVAVTRDAEGAILQRGDEMVQVPALKITPVDSTGAGDIYASGVLYGLCHGLDLRESGMIASYIAGTLVSRLGPRLDEIDQHVIARLKTGATFDELGL